MTFPSGALFLRRGVHVDTTISAVVADAIDSLVDHRGVIDVVNLCDIHVVYGTIVIEVIVVPATALIPMAEVSKSIVDSPIETNYRSPVSFVENEAASAPSPIAGSPEKSNFRG